MREICSVEGCGRKIVNREPKLCFKHWRRWKKWGDPNKVYIGGRKHSVDGPVQYETKCKYCDRNAVARGLCSTHYNSWYVWGDPEHIDRVKENKRGSHPTGFYETKQGYIIHKDKPYHREIVESIIGRELKKTEIVHHIDMDKSNNSPDNLYLCENRAMHNQCHYSAEQLISELFKEGKVVFKDGVYRRSK